MIYINDIYHANPAYNLITLAHLCRLYSKRKYAEIKLSYNVLRTLTTILMSKTLSNIVIRNETCRQHLKLLSLSD